jgi:hypothetical protein
MQVAKIGAAGPSGPVVSGIAKGVNATMTMLKLKIAGLIVGVILVVGGATAGATLRRGSAMEQASAGDPIDRAQAAAAAGDWAGAIDAYAEALTQTPVAGYRDKKDFSWIVTEYEKGFAALNKPVNYEPFKKILNEKLQAHPKDLIYTWRLHRALAGIAETAQDVAAEKSELLAAIAEYPSAVEGDPSKHSSLQHLYNQYAMILAQSDVVGAEDYIRKGFQGDARFVYFFSPPWRNLFQDKKMPGEFTKLMKQVSNLYEAKAIEQPGEQTLLKRYKAELDAEAR